MMSVRSGSDGSARRLFFASLLYLPLLLGLMIADRGPVKSGAARRMLAAETQDAAAEPATAAEAGPFR